MSSWTHDNEHARPASRLLSRKNHSVVPPAKSSDKTTNKLPFCRSPGHRARLQRYCRGICFRCQRCGARPVSFERMSVKPVCMGFTWFCRWESTNQADRQDDGFFPTPSGTSRTLRTDSVSPTCSSIIVGVDACELACVQKRTFGQERSNSSTTKICQV